MEQNIARRGRPHRVSACVPEVRAKSAATVRPDRLLRVIANYVVRDAVYSTASMNMARYCLMDALGCALQAFDSAECTRHIGPVVPGTVVPNGACVPGTRFQLDPVKAAFDISCLIRWFDFNAVWFAGGSPADTLGTVLAIADYVSRRAVARGGQAMRMKEVLGYLIKAYEIHGMLSGANKIDRSDIGLDSTILVKIASAAIATKMLGGDRSQIINALSNVFVDQQALDLYRIHPHTGPRKSWAAADAARRGVQFAFFCIAGEPGYPAAISTKHWGFCDAQLKGQEFNPPQRLGSHVVRNVQFKLAFPTQRHCQSAAECAVALHPEIIDQLDQIERIEIYTHGLAARVVNVSGQLANYAARDHCMQYIVAVALLHGGITTDSYSDTFAADRRIDALRALMIVKEDPVYTRGHHDPKIRSNANAQQVFFKDGRVTRKIEVIYPIGDSHRRRADLPLLEQKFKANMARRLTPRRQRQVYNLLSSQEKLETTAMDKFMNMLLV